MSNVHIDYKFFTLQIHVFRQQFDEQHYDMYLGGAWFESWPDDRLFWYSVVVFGLYRLIL